MDANANLDVNADIIIVGAGLAGLHCALRLSEKYPRKKIAILESYSMAGGRVSTFKKGKVHWESGAGRIPESHTMLSKYCKKYSLTRFPISSESMYIGDAGTLQQNIWDSLVSIINTKIANIPRSTLGHYTMYEVLQKLFDKEVVDDIITYFPYRSELITMRADLAFSYEFSSKESFYGIKEGLSAIIEGMVKDLRKRGVVFLYKYRVTGLGANVFPMRIHAMTPYGMKTFSADKIIFAVHANALRAISPFSMYPILKHLKMTPLLRTYAIFPHEKKVWFEDLPRVVTNNALRHIIPINAKKGIIMTSYTDADDTRKWNILRKKGDTFLTKALVKELRALLPLKTIPNPLYSSSHYWEDGCTYWTPGSYDPVKESNDIMRPFPTRFPDIYVCGESYSMKQAWMEGALEHADAMLEKYFFLP